MRATRHRSLEKVVVSTADGTFWRPSYPEGYDEGDALASLFSGKGGFFFRGIRRVHRRWLPDYWEDTGAIWQMDWPASGRFKVLDNSHAISRWREGAFR